MHVPTLAPKTYFLAYLALLALLCANVGIGYLNLGWGNMFIAVTIATIQAALMVLVLMHGMFEKPAVWLAIGGALLWFMILVTLTMTDYITRNWLPVAGK
jgi:cytochrome c oxidase subunit 4